jgi:hypothetical protein
MKERGHRPLKRPVAGIRLAFWTFSAFNARLGMGEIISISATSIRFSTSAKVSPGTKLEVFPRLKRRPFAIRSPRCSWTGEVAQVRPRKAGKLDVHMRFSIPSQNRLAEIA